MASTASAVPTSCRDCALAAPLKHMKTETKIVGSSRCRVEGNGLQIVVDLVPLCLRTASPSSCRTDTFFFSAKKKAKNSPLKMFGTTVVPPFAIAKPFNAALLAGVRVAQVLVSLWELLPKMFPSEGSQARFETTDCGSTWFFSRSCSATILVDVRVVHVLC